MADTPRRKKFPVPPAALAATDHGSLPPPPGTVLGRVPLQAVRGQEDLTAAEREIVEGAGWRAGIDPIPDFRGTAVGKHMEAAVAGVKAEAENHHGLTPIDPSTPPLELPVPVDIEDLPPDEQARAMQVFKEMDELQDRMNAARLAKTQAKAKNSLMSTPGATAAIAVATAAAQREAAGVSLVDDIGMTDVQDCPAPPPFTLKPDVEHVNVPVQEAEAEPEPESCSHDQNSEGSGAALTGTTTNCPQCNFDLNSELVVPTTEDIASYLSALLGEGRFRKEIKLFGGRITIVFRGLLPKEIDYALKLADEEAAAGNVQHIMQYARVAEGYKLVMGVESVTRAGHGLIKLPEINDIAEHDEGPTPIMQMKEYLDNDVFTTDSLRRTVGNQWVKFNRLLQFMEAKAESPDFFGPIA